jgi:hypothetical protein
MASMASADTTPTPPAAAAPLSPSLLLLLLLLLLRSVVGVAGKGTVARPQKPASSAASCTARPTSLPLYLDQRGTRTATVKKQEPRTGKGQAKGLLGGTNQLALVPKRQG